MGSAHAAGSSANRLGAYRSQLGLLPGIKPTYNVEDVMETRALEQACGDYAAVAAFAVHCERRVAIDLWR